MLVLYSYSQAAGETSDKVSDDKKETDNAFSNNKDSTREADSMDTDKQSTKKVEEDTREDEYKYIGFTSYAEAVQNGTFNSFHVLGNYRQLQQDEQNAMMKEDDASNDTYKQQGAGERYLQCVGLKYGSLDEVRTKIMVVCKIINAVMKLIKEIEQSMTRVKLTKWRNENFTAWLCSHVGNGAKTVSEYINSF